MKILVIALISLCCLIVIRFISKDDHKLVWNIACTINLIAIGILAFNSYFQSEKLKNQQKFIKSIAVEIKMTYQTIDSKVTSGLTPQMTNPFHNVSNLGIVTPSKETYIYFAATSYFDNQVESNLCELTINYAYPQKQNQIIGKNLEEINGELYINCSWRNDIINHLEKYQDEGDVEYEITVTLNGIKSMNFRTRDLKNGNFKESNLQFYVPKEENKIVRVVMGIDEI